MVRTRNGRREKMIDLTKEVPLYHRVYVKLITEKANDNLNTSLELPKEFVEEYEQELDFKATLGKIVAMGPLAFEGYPESKKPKIGQTVRIDRYLGRLVNQPGEENSKDREIIRIMIDKEILGVIYE